ncbi:hypothetical protein ACKWTF_012186 [Chironomus riparius]
MPKSEENSYSISAISSPKKILSNDCVTTEKSGIVKFKKKHSQEKFENLRRCFGFFDFLKTSWRTFKEFSADTSIHGIKYLTDKQRNWTEKLFWSVALVLSIIACAYVIYLSWRKRIDSPLIFSFAPKPMNIWDIPFSAVTICPTGGINLSASILKNITGNVNKRITHVKWRHDEYHSSKLFTEIVTHEGFCYTFNMMNFYDLFETDVAFESLENLKDKTKHPNTAWDLQEGYKNSDPFTYPFRISGSGENGGLKFQIWRKISEVKAIKTLVKGFKLVIHLPCELPIFDQQYFRFPLEKSATLIIRPSMTVTEGLDAYSTDTRQCYIEGEKKLVYFKKYTRANCLLECLVKYTIEICGCVHFSLPRKIGEKVCNSSMENCFYQAKKKLALQKMKDSLNKNNNYGEVEKSSCKCLPSCTSLFYEGEISQDDIRYFSKSERILDAYRSVVSILFKDDDFLYTQSVTCSNFILPL